VTAPERVGVIGGGTMGTGIAYVFLAAGCTVTLVEPDATQAGRAREAIESRAAGAADRGKLDRATAERMPELLRTAGSVADLDAGLDLVVESVPERLDLKRQVLAAAEGREPVLLASNTSGLPITALGEALAHPDRFLGLHFFNPVWSMPLIEIVHTPASPPAGWASPWGSRRSGCSRTAWPPRRTSTRRWSSATGTRWGRCA
jgi:3-hydroxybutyryl-CoA dehydrogenase